MSACPSNSGASPLRDLRVDVRQRRVIEDAGRRIPYVLHRQSDTTRCFIDALRAPHIGALADTRHESQRPLENTNHFAEGDFGRRPPQKIAAAVTFLALDDALPLQ